MKKRTAVAILGLLLVSGIAVHGGSVAGRVTAVSGGGLTNVFIDLYDESGDYFDYTVTDSVGNYRFSNVGQGKFFVHTDTLGAYVEEWFDNVPGASDDTFFDPIAAGATLVPVAYDAAVTGINIALEKAGVISGRVTDIAGAPVANAYVDAYLPPGSRFLFDLTDTNGVYRLAGLPAGSYAVRTDTLGAFVDEWHTGSVAFDSVSPAEAGVSSLTVASGGQISGVNFQLGVGAEIRGVLRNEAGDSIPGAYVDLLSSSGTPLEFDRSDTNGVYQLKGLPAGGYYLGSDTLGSYVELWYDQKLMATPGQPAQDGADLVPVTAGQTVAGCDFTFDLGGAISGYVVNTGGQAIAEAFIDVYRGSNFFDYGVSDSVGEFRIGGLPDGLYYVKVDTLGEYLDEWYDDAIVRNIDDPAGDGAAAVMVTNGGAVSGLAFELGVGGEITGRLSDVADQGIANVYVDLYDDSGKRLFYTRSGTNGEYRLGGLPPGTYFLRTDAEGRYADEWYDNRPAILAANPTGDGALPLVLSSGQSRIGVDLQLRQGAVLSGTVVGTNSVPQAGTTIRLFFGSAPFVSRTTDSNGAYRVAALPAGTYYLRTDSAGGFLDEWYRDVYIFNADLPLSDGATPVVLADDEQRAGVDFALGLGAVITGMVKTVAGQAIEGVMVDLLDGQGRLYDWAVSEGNGSYRIESLPSGPWYVGTDSLGAYWDEWFNDVLRDHFTDPAADGATALTTVDGSTCTASFLLALAPPMPVVLGIGGMPLAPPVIEWQAVAGRAYQVERTDELATGIWYSAPSGTAEIETSFKVAGQGGLRQYRDPSQPARAVYRVRSL